MHRYQISTVFIVTVITFCLIIFLCCNINDSKKRYTEKDTIELGRYLFFDRRLSVNNTRSCGTCHNPQFAFTDGYRRSLGAFADLHQRNTQPLFNLSSLKYLTAADSSIHNTIQQINNPLFNTHPIEMGVGLNEEKILNTIKQDDNYQELFKASFPKEKNSISWLNIKTAISRFMLTIVSNNSPYDKYIAGDSDAITLQQKEGMKLFFSVQLKCVSCHGGLNFSTPSVTNEKGDTLFYFNTGLYNTDGKGAYPKYDQGLYQLTKNADDMGKFRVPSLRNLEFTAPYFHDGSAATLNEVIEVFAAGGRKITAGINSGDGTENPYKHAFINGFAISEKERNNLINFLMSLGDSSFIKNPDYQNPFTADETKKK